MKRLIYIAWITFLTACASTNAQNDNDAQVAVRVVDEQNSPISNANVSVSFDITKSANAFDGTAAKAKRGNTDQDGRWQTSAKTTGRIRVNAIKDGYYQSHKDFVFGDEVLNWSTSVNFTLVKIEAPVPMYAKRLERCFVPVVESPVGFDLAVGDWVAPHGKGIVSDLLVTLQREFRSRYDHYWQLNVQTPGDGNGLQVISPDETKAQSRLRFPRNAPETGYAISNIFMSFRDSSAGFSQTNSTSGSNFVFRVRSQYDGVKQLKSALYGKLLGPLDVNVQGTKTARLRFTYYLNPNALDRNLEFDPSNNLLKGLRVEEQVHDP